MATAISTRQPTYATAASDEGRPRTSASDLTPALNKKTSRVSLSSMLLWPDLTFIPGTGYAPGARPSVRQGKQ